ncbi:MAG: DUF7665 family protein [Pyrinomonadaceae bacterium]
MASRPDETTFLAHVEAGPFESGVDRGWWRLVSINWPHAILAISAAERADAPFEYAFRFEFSNYPTQLPTAQPWDPSTNVPLHFKKWPGGVDRVQHAFNPGFKEGTCLYLPCDRLAIEGHDAWRTQHPEMIWTAESDITLYLRIIYDLLHSKDYKGLRGA